MTQLSLEEQNQLVGLIQDTEGNLFDTFSRGIEAEDAQSLRNQLMSDEANITFWNATAINLYLHNKGNDLYASPVAINGALLEKLWKRHQDQDEFKPFLSWLKKCLGQSIDLETTQSLNWFWRCCDFIKMNVLALLILPMLLTFLFARRGLNPPHRLLKESTILKVLRNLPLLSVIASLYHIYTAYRDSSRLQELSHLLVTIPDVSVQAVTVDVEHEDMEKSLLSALPLHSERAQAADLQQLPISDDLLSDASEEIGESHSDKPPLSVPKDAPQHSTPQESKNPEDEVAVRRAEFDKKYDEALFALEQDDQVYYQTPERCSAAPSIFTSFEGSPAVVQHDELQTPKFAAKLNESNKSDSLRTPKLISEARYAEELVSPELSFSRSSGQHFISQGLLTPSFNSNTARNFRHEVSEDDDGLKTPSFAKGETRHSQQNHSKHSLLTPKFFPEQPQSMTPKFPSEAVHEDHELLLTPEHSPTIDQQSAHRNGADPLRTPPCKKSLFNPFDISPA